MIIDPAHPDSPAIAEHTLRDIDVCIEFTRPDAALNNVLALLECGKAVVTGTTGWHHHVDRVREAMARHEAGIVLGSNFTIGVQLLQRVTAMVASMLNTLTDFDIAIHEVHHTAKRDAPSGTALRLAEIVLQRLDRKTDVAAQGALEPIRPEQLSVTAQRLGSVFGEHTVSVDSSAETLRIEHQAKSREGFADGALMAAQWIRHRKGLHYFEEVFDEITSA
jgi:4-hydroxy-tetrahydrodipicolinate reductase